MFNDEATMLARADLDLCVLLPAVLVALGDIVAAQMLSDAAPRIRTVADLESWHAAIPARGDCSVLGYALHGYAYDIPEALLDSPDDFAEVVAGFEDECRRAVAVLLGRAA